MDEARLDYLAGMKYKDIAEKYNVALSTVKSWKTRNAGNVQKRLKKVRVQKQKVCVQKSKKLHALAVQIFLKN